MLLLVLLQHWSLLANGQILSHLSNQVLVVQPIVAVIRLHFPCKLTRRSSVQPLHDPRGRR